jgi:hypothetical protein
VEEHLPGKCKALSLVPSTGKKKKKKEKIEKKKKQNTCMKELCRLKALKKNVVIKLNAFNSYVLFSLRKC